MARAFTAGMAVGVVATLLGLLFGLTSGFGTLAPLVESAVGDVLENGQVAIGHLRFTDRDSTYMAAFVYARATVGTGRLMEDLARATGAEDLTPPAVRDAVCESNGGCPTPRTVGELVQENLTAALDSMLRESRATLVGDATASIRTAGDGGTLLLSIAQVERDPAPPPAPTVPLQNASRMLRDACSVALPPATCGATYVAFDVEATWNGSFRAHLDAATENETAVLGPLAWRSLLAGAAEAGRSLYLPTAALVAVALAVLASILVQEVAEQLGGNFFLPLPPVAILVGVAVLALVNHLRPAKPVLLFVLPAYALLLILGVAVWRVWDASGVQYYSFLSTFGALFAAGGGLAYGLLTGIGPGPDPLFASLFDGSFSARMQRVALHAISWGLAATLVALVMTTSVAAHAYASGRRALPQRKLRLLLDRPQREFDDVMAKLDPTKGGRLSPQAFASVLARAYGLARRRDRVAWMRDALFLEAAMPARPSQDPNKGPVVPHDRRKHPVRAHDLWERHRSRARAAQGRVSLAV